MVTTFAKSVDAASLKTDVSGVNVATAGNTVVIQGGSITTSGDQHFAELVVLDKTDTTTNTITTLTSTNGMVTFDAAIHNAVSTAPQSLSVAAAGDVLFSGALGEATSALGDLVINTPTVTTFAKSVDAASLKTDVSGVNVATAGNTVVIQGGRITTSGTQTYNEAVLLNNSAHATTLNTSNVAVLFGDSLNNATTSAEALTINAGTGAVTFQGAVGNSTNLAMGALAVNSGAATTFTSTVDAASVSTDAAGTVLIKGGRITTSGAQTYSDAMTLGAHTILASTGGAVNFVSIEDGTSAFDLNVQSATALALGDVDIGGHLHVTTGAGGVSQLTGTRLKVGDTATFTADTGTHQVAALTSTHNTFTGLLTLNQINSGSWADVSVTTNAPLALGPLQSAGSVNLQTQGALTTSTVSTSGDLTVNSHGAAVSLGAVVVSGDMAVQTGGGAMAQTGQFVVTGDTSVAAGTGTITLLNALNNFGGSLALQGTSTSVATSGDLQLASVTNSGPMTLRAPNGSIDLGTAFITGGDLTLQSRDNMNLGGANITGSLNMSSTTGTVSFGQATVTGNLTAITQGHQVDLGSANVGGNLSVQTNGGSIVQSTTPNAALQVTGTSTLNAGTGNVTLPNIPNQFGGVVSLQANNVQLVGSNGLILGNSTVNGNLSVTAATGNVTQNAPLNVTGTSTFTATRGDVVLAQANTFAQPVAVNAVNANLHSASALTLGASNVTGNLMATVNQGDLTQTGPLTVGGKTDLLTATGNVTLANTANSFADLVSVDTAGTLKLTSGGPLTLGQVKTVGDTDLQSNGKLDLGTSVFGAKVNANSGGFDIVQTGPIKVGGNSNFEAGSAKIDLFNPKNQWSGSILYKGGIVMINHPQLMNAVNAGTLVVRAETSSVQPAKVSAPTSTGTPAANVPSSGTANGDSAVSVAVTRPASSNQTGLITVAVSSEAAAPGRSFSFSIESQVPAAATTNTEVRVTQADGKPLPEWLRYEAATKTFVATTVPPGAFPLQLKVGIGGVETLMVINEKPPGK